MAQQSVLKNYDQRTMVLAVLALLIALIAVYFQSFYKVTKLTVISRDILTYDVSDDTLRLEGHLLLSNTGDNQVALIGEWTFLNFSGESSNGWRMRGYDSDDDSPVSQWGGFVGEEESLTYTFSEKDVTHQVMDPNSIDLVRVAMGVDATTLRRLVESRQIKKDEQLKFCTSWTVIDSEGKKKHVVIPISYFNFTMAEGDSLDIATTQTHILEENEFFEIY